MAYTKTTWVNGTTPVDATNMNKIENGISTLDTGKLDKTAVVNTTTEAIANGKALNAVQNNPNIAGTLANQISILKDSPNFTGSPTIQNKQIAVV